MRTAAGPEINAEPKVVAEGAEEVIELTEKDRKKPKSSPDVIPAEAGIQKPSEISSPPNSQSEQAQDAKARRGLEASDTRALELKILDLEEEKERIESMDLSQMAAKVAELTPTQKAAAKKMMKTGKYEMPKGTPESEAAGAEMNRIFQRIPQINRELADLRRQLRRAQLGGVSPRLDKEGLGVVEKPEGGARGGKPPEAAPVTTPAPEAPPTAPSAPEAAAPAETPTVEAPANLPIAEEPAPSAPEKPKVAEVGEMDIIRAKSFKELDTILDNLKRLRGKNKTYSVKELKKIISAVRKKRMGIDKITETGGLRETIERLMQNEE